MSNKLSRRRFLRASAFAGAGVVLASCTPSTSPTTAPPATQATEAGAEGTQTPASPSVAPTKPVVEVIIARGEHPSQPILQDAPAHLATGQATGLKLVFQPIPSADYAAKSQLWLATGQVPDLMLADVGSIRDYAHPSVLRPIMPLVEQHGPNLKKYLEAYPEVRKWAINGELYLFPRRCYHWKRNAPMPLIRKDWLDETGLPLPEDFDQLYEVLSELKKAHPEAVGWTARGGIKRLLMIAAYPMGSGLGGWIRGKDTPYYDEAVDGGRWVYGPVHSEFKDVLEYFAKLYKDGLLDPDLPSTTDDQWHEKNSSNKGFFSMDNISFCVRWNLALREVDAKATWLPFPTLRGKKGRRQNDFGGFQGGWVIGANCKHPDRVVELLNWQLSPIGLDTTCWGIEGVHYSLKGPRPDTIEDYTMEAVGRAMDDKLRELVPEVYEKYKQKADPFRSFQSDTGTGLLDFTVIWDQAITYLWDPPGEADSWYQMTEADPGLHPEVIVPPFTAEESERLKNITAEVNAILDPAFDKVVLGQMSLTDYDKAVQQAIQAGALDLERIYNEAEARVG